MNVAVGCRLGEDADGLKPDWSMNRGSFLGDGHERAFAHLGIQDPAIQRRRNALRDLASIGNASDPLVATTAQVASEKADEYDLLLNEIERSE